MLNMRSITTYVILATVAVSAVVVIPAVAAADENETKLIGLLTSKAPQPAKAITCKKLAIFGSKAAVPHWRRYWRTRIWRRGPGSPWRRFPARKPTRRCAKPPAHSKETC